MRLECSAPIVACLIAIQGTACGQTITAMGGNATFTYNTRAVPTTATGIGGGSSNLSLGGTADYGDQLFENWWWYREHVADTREHRYNSSGNPFTASGDTMTGTFTFERFRSDLTYTITDADGPGIGTAHLLMRNLITNTSASPITLNIYSYADLDAGGRVQQPYSYNTARGWFECVGENAITGYYQGFGAARHQAAPYTSSSGTPVRGLVSDGDVDNLDDTVAGTFGDFTGAFQYFIYLEPGETRSLYVSLGINTLLVPGPSAVGVLMPLIVPCVSRRRPVNRACVG